MQTYVMNLRLHRGESVYTDLCLHNNKDLQLHRQIFPIQGSIAP